MRIDATVHSGTEETIHSLHRLLDEKSDTRDQIVTSVSLVESLATRFIDELVTVSGVEATPLGKKLLEKNIDSFHQSWERRHEWLNAGFNINMSSSVQWQRLRIVTQVRNAIIHGGGVLTKKQVSGVSAAVEMRRMVKEVLAGDIQGRRVIFSESSGRRAVLVVVEYALELDRAVVRWLLEGPPTS